MAKSFAKSRSKTAREIPLPRAKRTDPPIPRIPTDPRTWPAERHVFGIASRKYFARPQSPWTFDHGLAPEIVAACVVREVMLALDLRRFPAKRWADWLTRRALALYRVEKKFRARMDGPHEREYCYTYMRHWLYIGLHKSHWKYAEVLSDDMWAGHPPAADPLRAWRLKPLRAA